MSAVLQTNAKSTKAFYEKSSNMLSVLLLKQELSSHVQVSESALLQNCSVIMLPDKESRAYLTYTSQCVTMVIPH